MRVVLLTLAQLAAVVAIIMITGCGATLLDRATNAANASASFGKEAERVLGELYERAQHQAIEESRTEEEARDRVAAVRAQFAEAWAAYDAYRATWIATAAAIEAGRSIEAAGEEYDERAAMRALADLVHAQTAFAKAAKAIGAVGDAETVSAGEQN